VLTLVFAVLVMVIAAAVLSAPLLLHRLEPYLMPAPRGAERSAADRILEALSDLEQSRLSGKVTPAGYAAQREKLETEYIQVTERNA
jgi:hypothetical protein